MDSTSFEQALQKLCNEAGYKRLRQSINKYGAIEAVKRIIIKNTETDRFKKLVEQNQLALSVEALIINPNFAPLFTDEEVDICRQKLKKYGFMGG